MNVEKSEEQEKRTARDRLNDLEGMLPSYDASVPDERPEPGNDQVIKRTVADWMTATYWG